MKIYQVDAFAQKPFEGNPAAVVPLKTWPDKKLMQRIAQENNLAETAFFVPKDIHGQYELRWFTPTHEVDLCGHATLASAHVLYAELGQQAPTLEFETRSGPLLVSRTHNGYKMDFPEQKPKVCAYSSILKEGLGGVSALACLQSEDYIVVLENEADVLSVRPDFDILSKLDLRGVIVTAVHSGNYDFVARFFGPKVGVPEDSVTGSAYTQLAPYWSTQLDKSRLFACQVASRGGELNLELVNDRVLITGQAVTFMRGVIDII